ncbi:MAG: sugar phosphate isomerase/epimerase [Ruminococcaceae bacterium]|nr:sugar phosphate isomerase/epimerase [Oscillospiraceae bacterium]
MKKMRISSPLNMHAYPKEDISEFIRQGLLFNKKAGFDATDFSVTLVDVTRDNWQTVVEKAVADANEIGVPFEVGHLPFIGKGGTKDPEVLRAFSEKMFRSIDAAKLSGIKYAVMHPNAVTLPMRQYDRTAQYDIVMTHLSPFVEYANKVGLNVVVENMRLVHATVAAHRYCQAPDELCEVADALGIGICWDFGHAHISGVKQSEALAMIGKRLKVIHVNDNYAGDDTHEPPFIGSVDWKDAMHGLALADFDGVFNFEAGCGKLPASMRETYAKYLVQAADELMSMIE